MLVFSCKIIKLKIIAFVTARNTKYTNGRYKITPQNYITVGVPVLMLLQSGLSL